MMQKRSIVWKRKDAGTAEKRNLQFIDGSHQEDNIVIHKPTEHFANKLLDQSMLDKIVEELNKYAIQKSPNKPLRLTNSELEQFIGILYVLSLVKMPSSRVC